MRLSVKSLLLLSFSTLLLLVVIVSVGAIHYLDKSKQTLDHIVHGVSERAIIAEEIRVASLMRAISARNLILSSSTVNRDKYLRQSEDEHQKVIDTMAHLKEHLDQDVDVTSKEKMLADDFWELENVYAAVALKIVDLAHKGESEQATALLKEQCIPLLEKLVSTSDNYVAYLREFSAIVEKRALDEYPVQKAYLLTICAIAIVVAALLGTAITRKLLSVLGAEPRKLSEEAERVASGDLTIGQHDYSNGVMHSLGEMQRKLNTVLATVKEVANNISGAAHEMSNQAEISKSDVLKEKSDIEQIATAIHQLSTTAEAVAELCEAASTATQRAVSQANLGRNLSSKAASEIEQLSQEVNRSADAMTVLKTESQTIGGVLDVIKSVADQTNLLALNAAIEAARAGDAGRGFAVVADEVRGLAKRTQDATQEIEGLISGLRSISDEVVSIMDRCKKVTDSTVEDVKKAGGAAREIMETIDAIERMNLQIATATEQQTTVTADISRGVMELNHVADLTAKTTDNTSGLSKELLRLGDTLKSHVEKFKLTA